MEEEIIIDGVNIAECEFAIKPINDNRIKCHCVKGLLQIAKMQEQPESIKGGFCENNPECYYKQLKRLENCLEEIKAELKDDLTCESRECGCDDYGECLECLKETILNIITEAKGGKQCQQ